jgi:hypothetical protein
MDTAPAHILKTMVFRGLDGARVKKNGVRQGPDIWSRFRTVIQRDTGLVVAAHKDKHGKMIPARKKEYRTIKWMDTKGWFKANAASEAGKMHCSETHLWEYLSCLGEIAKIFQALDKNWRYSDRAGSLADAFGLKIAWGNRKIPRDTLILNMGPAYLCPSDMGGYCDLGFWGGEVSQERGTCYALATERAYPGASAARTVSMIQWWLLPPSFFANNIIAAIHGRRSVTKFVRFNESGNFWRGKYSGQRANEVLTGEEKLRAVMHLVNQDEKCRNIRFYTYTHNKDVKVKLFPPNMTVNASGFRKFNDGTQSQNVFAIDKPKTHDKAGAEQVAWDWEKLLRQDFSRPFTDPYMVGNTCKMNCKRCDLCKTHGTGQRIIFIPHHTAANAHAMKLVKQRTLWPAFARVGFKLTEDEMAEETVPSINPNL